MWTRKEVKTNAKSALKGRYWLAFLVSFLAVVIITGSLLSSGIFDGHKKNMDYETRFEQRYSDFEAEVKEFLTDADMSRVFPMIGIFIGVVVILGIIVGLLAIGFTIAYAVFISNPATVGHNKFYLDNRKGRAEAGKLLSSFGADYRNIVKVMFFKNLRVFLWSLLFIVPGIIKAIEYMMVDYLLADYPKIELKRALQLSSGITGGQKWAIFKLYLSFTGWFILCLITGGIGFVFLNPYLQATVTELYAILIEKQMGDISETSADSADSKELPEMLPGM